MNETYLAAAGRIRHEVQELRHVVERTLHIWQKHSADAYYVDAAALNLHGFYAGVEHLLELIADAVDQTKPTGSNWHQELLKQMAAAVPNIRPAVLDAQTRNQLDKYRDFQHVVRNVYTFHLDADQIGLLVQQLPGTLDATSHALLDFADLLEQISNHQ